MIEKDIDNINSTFENDHNLLFIDSGIDNYETLISGVKNSELILLDSTKNGIEQITEILNNYAEVDSIHIISHGQSGTLQLGSTNLNTNNLNNYANDLGVWSESLTEQGDILLYGCNVGAELVGVDFINSLSQLTNADIAASNNLTGNSQLGGDWDFEITVGNIEADLAINAATRDSYDSLLELLIDFEDFADMSQLKLNGDATQADDRLRLTSLDTFQSGSAFFEQAIKVDPNTSFNTQFQFQLSGGTDGADGITFMLQNNIQGLNALGKRGSRIGYGGITESLAIEFDSYQNDYDNDNNHISVLQNGRFNASLATTAAPFDLNSGSFLNAWIDYDGESDLLEVFLADTLAKPETASLSLNFDLASVVGSKAFFGFSAGTGRRANIHDITKWEFATDSRIVDEEPGDIYNVASEIIISDLRRPTAIEWTPSDETLETFFIAEKDGVIKVVQDGELQTTPFIDLSAQVNGRADRGLIDIAVHPDFFNGSPYVYAAYVYDPPEVLQNTGLAGEDGTGNRASRLTRITADASTNFTTAIPGSEVVILGKNSIWENFNGFVDSTSDFDEPPAGILADGTNLEDFLAIDSLSHAIGGVEFGPDGALYVSNGDGTSFNRADPRTFRVQDLDNLSGKILRIDPITGEGLSDNPFYDDENPDANRSKVYQYGLRNPFRLAIDQTDGQVYIGDVGWRKWEEINAAEPGANFGWPFYEGGNGNNIQTPQYQDLPEAQEFYASGETATPAILGLNHGTDGINAIVLGDFYTGNVYPEELQGNLFFNDLGQGIVRNISFDESGNITSVDDFTTGAQRVVQIKEGPDGHLYYVNLTDGTVGRWVVSRI